MDSFLAAAVLEEELQEELIIANMTTNATLANADDVKTFFVALEVRIIIIFLKTQKLNSGKYWQFLAHYKIQILYKFWAPKS